MVRTKWQTMQKKVYNTKYCLIKTDKLAIYWREI